MLLFKPLLFQLWLSQRLYLPQKVKMQGRSGWICVTNIWCSDPITSPRHMPEALVQIWLVWSYWVSTRSGMWQVLYWSSELTSVYRNRNVAYGSIMKINGERIIKATSMLYVYTTDQSGLEGWMCRVQNLVLRTWCPHILGYGVF